MAAAILLGEHGLHTAPRDTGYAAADGTFELDAGR
jgi:hypothetical protein